MGRVIFVIGLPASGKSYFIKNNFPNAKVVDLFNYQHEYDSYMSVIDSYFKSLADLVNEVIYQENYGTGQDVVLEHTLVKSKRRNIYIDAIRDYCGKDIECFYTDPTAKQYAKTVNYREGITRDIDDYQIEKAQSMLSQFDIPTIEEGFHSVTKIHCDV